MWLYEVTFVLVPALGYSKWKPWLVTVIVLCLLVYLGTPLTDRMLCLLSSALHSVFGYTVNSYEISHSWSPGRRK